MMQEFHYIKTKRGHGRLALNRYPSSNDYYYFFLNIWPRALAFPIFFFFNFYNRYLYKYLKIGPKKTYLNLKDSIVPKFL